MILSNFSSIEHSIKAGNFINLHGCHVKNLSDFVHCGESQEVVVLLLRYEEQGDYCGMLIV